MCSMHTQGLEEKSMHVNGRNCGWVFQFCSSHMQTRSQCAVGMHLTASFTCSKVHPHKPASALAGFMRFLHVLSQNEWQAYPMLCDPANSLRDDEIKDALKAHRALLPSSSAPACCLITPYDLGGATWTKERPAAVITTRMRRLAATSLDCMTRAVVRSGQWKDAEDGCAS